VDDATGDGITVDGEVADIDAVTSPVDLLRGGGRRIASDGLGPSLAFYVGYRAVGLGLGIALAVIVAVLAWANARRQGRTGLLPWITLVMVVIQGSIGLIAGDAKGFFAPQLVTSAIWGVGMIGSVLIGRPLVAVFARELFPFPEEVRTSDEFRRVNAVISLVFGISILLRGAVRYVQLTNGSIDGYVLVSLLTGFPVTFLTISWGLWYSRRALRRSTALAPGLLAD
jgi:intracellular septation protein A